MENPGKKSISEIALTILAVAALVTLVALLLPDYVAYISRRSEAINRGIAAKNEVNSREAWDIGSLRTLATAAETFRTEKKRFPRDEPELVESGLVSEEFFGSVTYVDVDATHFIGTAQVGSDAFCVDQTQVVRRGQIASTGCGGAEVK